MADKKLCSMYSYKGGTGRTVATANIACILAKSNKKVVCIDMDLDGGGLAVVFKVNSVVNESVARINDSRRCIQDVLRKEWTYAIDKGVRVTKLYEESVDKDDFIKNWWDKMSFDLGKEWRKDIAGKLYFIPARFGTDSIETDSEMEPRFNRFIELLIEHIKPDILIFDSSSGLQDYSTMLIKNCDLLVTFFRWNSQAIEGTIKASEYIFKKNPDIKMLLVPTAVPKESLLNNKYYKGIHETGEMRIEGKISEMKKMLEDRNVWEENKIAFYKNGIGESTTLKWKEELLIFKDNPEEEEKNILEEYKDVAQRIINLLEQ